MNTCTCCVSCLRMLYKYRNVVVQSESEIRGHGALQQSRTPRRRHGASSRGAVESQEACRATEEGPPTPCPAPCRVCAPAAPAWPSCGASRASSWGPPCPPIIVGAPSMEESRARTRDSVLPRCAPSPPPSRGPRSMGGCTQSRQQRGKVVYRGSPDRGAASGCSRSVAPAQRNRLDSARRLVARDQGAD